MIEIKPIEDYSPLRHTALIAEAVSELVPEYLASLRVMAHPYRVIPSKPQYDLSFDVEEVVTGTITNVALAHTASGTETVSDLTINIVNDFNTQGFPVFAEAVVDYNEDVEMYLTVVSQEGYRIVSAPTPVNLNIDTSVTVQAANGKPAGFGMGQRILEQDYPRLIVTALPITSVQENWAKGVIERDRGLGDGLQMYPHNDRYVRGTYQVTVESGSVDEVLKLGRMDSGGILQKFLNRIKEENKRNAFWQKVQGTLSRDFTVTPIPSLDYTNYEDSSIMTFSLDMILREVEYEMGIVTNVELDGIVTDREEKYPNPVSFDIETVSFKNLPLLELAVKNFTDYLNNTLRPDLT